MRPIFPLTILILLAVFAVALPRTDTESLWYDEAWSVWATASPAPATYEPPRGLRARLTTPLYAARDDLTTTWARVSGDVHPPLYFLLLDAWTPLVGSSVFALRYLSLLVGLVGLAATAALGRRLSAGGAAGVYAAGLLGTSLLWTYYAREARMYTLLVTFAVAGTLAYTRFSARPSWWRGALYATLTALGVYTHYTAALVPLAHALHTLADRRRLLPWVAAMAAAVVLYAPWLPTLYTQLINNPNGPLATPEPTNWTTISTLTGYFAARGGPVYLVLAALAVWAAWRGIARWQSVGLYALWLVVVPGMVLAANALLLPVYNPRYTLAALPALFLLAGEGLAALERVRFGRWLAVAVAVGLALDGLSAYDGGWGAKPPYQEVVARATAARAPLDAALVRVVGYDPFAYHGGRAGLFGANTVNVAGTERPVDATRALVRQLASTDPVWLMMPTNHPETWHTVAALLAQGRSVTYRDGVQNMVVYRLGFADAPPPPLALTWGTLAGEPVAQFDGALAVDVDATPGEPLCLLPPVIPSGKRGELVVSVSLAHGYNLVIDQWHGPPGETACLTPPPDAVGDYALYISLTNTTGAPYPVWDELVWWGNWVVAYRVRITP